MKNQQAYSFQNWGENIVHTTPNYFQPETEEELINIIRTHNKIRVVGSGHSWSDICVSDDTLINLDKYQRVISINRETQLVQVQAGIKLYQLNEQLVRRNLALENLGSIDQQSISGAISTGTHGTGIGFQILGSMLVEFTLILADGSKLVVNKEKDPDLYHATIVNLGCLGVISEVTLKAVAAFRLHDHTTTLPFDQVIQNLDHYLKKNDHFKLWWLPPTKDIVVYQYQRTQEPANDSRIRRYLKDEVFSVAAYRSLVFMAKKSPGLATSINKLLTNQMKGPLDRIEDSYKVYIVPEPPKHVETEWAFDVADASNILKAYRDLIVNHRYKMNFIQEIRFSQKDSFWLSPSQGRDTMWIGLYCFKHEKWNEILPVFEEFAQKHGGRPHWGKIFNTDKDYLQKQYPNYHKFIELKNKLDPQQKFTNAYIERLFE